jgi:hypothetical protein
LLGSACLAEAAGRRLSSAAILLDFEIDLLAFNEVRHASTLNRGDVDENVRAAIVGLDEAEALGAVEPLDRSRCHSRIPSVCCVGQAGLRRSTACIEILGIDVSKREFFAGIPIDRPKYQSVGYSLDDK